MCIVFMDVILYPPQAHVQHCHGLGMVFLNLVLLGKRLVKIYPHHCSPMGGTEGRDHGLR